MPGERFSASRNKNSGLSILCFEPGARASRPFLVTGIIAIVAGGLIAGAIAHAPSRNLVWMVSYLVLVVGIAECAFGTGRLFWPRMCRPHSGLGLSGGCSIWGMPA